MITSDEVWAEVSRPRRAGVVPQADAAGQAGVPGQGGYIIVTLSIQDEVVRDARFQTWGCPSAVACGIWITEWAMEKTLDAADEIDTENLVNGLRGLPLGREYCAIQAVAALKDAIRRFRVS